MANKDQNGKSSSGKNKPKLNAKEKKERKARKALAKSSKGSVIDPGR